MKEMNKSELDYGELLIDDSNAIKWIEKQGAKAGYFANGQWKKGKGLEQYSVKHSLTQAVLTRFPICKKKAIDKALVASAQAQKDWSKRSSIDRSKYLLRLAKQLEKNLTLLSVLQSTETGRHYYSIQNKELPTAIDYIDYYASQATRLSHDTSIGVVVLILDTNTSFVQLAQCLAPALAAGNTIVLKPSSQHYLLAVLLIECCVAIGLPKGVISLITGDETTEHILLGQKNIAKFIYAGYARRGKEIQHKLALINPTQSILLDLNGALYFTLFADADLDSAIEVIVQTAMDKSRILLWDRIEVWVQESIATIFLEKLNARIDRISYGNPLDQNIDTYLGINPIKTEPFRTIKEAILLVNNNRDNLAMSIWSENMATLMEVAMNVKVGMIWANEVLAVDAAVAFGAYRESGNLIKGGREGLAIYQKESNTYSEKNSTSLSLDTSINNSARHTINKAVQIAQKEQAWEYLASKEHNQFLYKLIKELERQQSWWIERLMETEKVDKTLAKSKFQAVIDCIYYHTAINEKSSTTVENRKLQLTCYEPLGIIGILGAEKQSLLGIVASILPAILNGNRVLYIPAITNNTLALDFAKVLTQINLPKGVIQIIADDPENLGMVLAKHHGVGALWSFNDKVSLRGLKVVGVDNLKQIWSVEGLSMNWLSSKGLLTKKARRMKTIWLPYGNSI